MAIVIAIILAIGSVASFGSQSGMISSSSLELVIVIMSLVVGSTFCIWLGDQITVKGFGNGTSILIFVNIISRLPLTVSKVLSLESR